MESSLIEILHPGSFYISTGQSSQSKGPEMCLSCMKRRATLSTWSRVFLCVSPTSAFHSELRSFPGRAGEAERGGADAQIGQNKMALKRKKNALKKEEVPREKWRSEVRHVKNASPIKQLLWEGGARVRIAERKAWGRWGWMKRKEAEQKKRRMILMLVQRLKSSSGSTGLI